MDIFVENTLEVKSMTELLSSFNSSQTVTTYTQYERNLQVLPMGATWVVLDYGHVTAPKYIKLKASIPVDIIIWAETFINCSTFEMMGDVPAISVTNSSGSEESVVDFIVLS